MNFYFIKAHIKSLLYFIMALSAACVIIGIIIMLYTLFGIWGCIITGLLVIAIVYLGDKDF